MANSETCPICGGRGFVSRGFYSTTTGQWSSSSAGAMETCRTCHGTGVWVPVADDLTRTQTHWLLCWREGSLPEHAACARRHAEEAEHRLSEIPDGLRVVLLDHWVSRIICDHEAQTDQVVCSCSQVALPIRSSVGAAVAAWIEHVLQASRPWIPDAAHEEQIERLIKDA